MAGHSAENKDSLGWTKTYQKEEIELEFVYSNKSIKKSIRETANNRIDEREYLDILSCLDEVIDSSVLIERHSDKTGNKDTRLNQVYVLLGGYTKNGIITPIQLEIKENVGMDNQLYLAVTIKKSGINETAIAKAKAEATSVSTPDFYTVSVQDLISKVNTEATDSLKYIPTELNDTPFWAAHSAKHH